eukprot:TRINITY_DN10930_c0_g2_i1.p1 TRINITY_DN10930_c0_g2~~TRINITY_DN10930_c0_g2_i1.p1  ORF type:complete len:317 (-),score=58.32 TRINITY_DN10930_c0_g2_i1:225-1175(-)
MIVNMSWIVFLVASLLLVDKLEAKVVFITYHTSGTPFIASNFPEKITNVGAGKTFTGWKSRVETYQQYFNNTGNKLQDDDLAVVLDGGDVAWGGCSKHNFEERFIGLTAGSKTKILFGGEMNCYQNDCANVPAPPAKFNANWPAYGSCCGGCSCTNPISLRYLNAGFYAGRVKDVRNMLNEIIPKFSEYTHGTNDDQNGYATYWLKNKDTMSIDYSTKLVVNLQLTNSNLITLNKEGKLYNNLFKEVTCFMHGAGIGKPQVRALAGSMPNKTAAPTFLKPRKPAEQNQQSPLRRLAAEFAARNPKDVAARLWNGEQ